MRASSKVALAASRVLNELAVDLEGASLKTSLRFDS